MRLYGCILVSCLFISLAMGEARSGISSAPDIPADYIIAGNLNHELGQRWLKARGLKGQGEFEQARIQYIMLLTTYSDLIQARFEYVQVLEVLGRFDEMEVELETLLDLDSANLQYKKKLGVLFLEHNQEKQGLRLLDEVWQEQPDVPLGQLLYQHYMGRDQKQKTLVVLEYLYKQSVHDVRLQEELFVLYIELGDDQKAQNLVPTLAEHSQTSLDRLILAAHLHERLGLDHLAADYWQAVLKKQPEYQLAHENLAQYYMVNSRTSEALPHKIFLYNHNGNNHKIAGEIGDYYISISECPKAIFFLEQSLAADSTQVERWKSLAYCYKAGEKMADAALAFDTYFHLQVIPTVEDRLTGAQVFEAVGMVDKAAAQYRELLAINPGDVAVLESLAGVETARGNLSEALTVWKQVAQRKVNDVACRTQILSLSEKLGITDVQSVLAEIHALDENNHRASLLLALAALKRGEMQQGMELFQPLAEREFFSAELLSLRGEIFLLLQQPEHSFRDFSDAIKKDSEIAESVVLGLLKVAGVLGRLDVVKKLNHRYHFDSSSDVQDVLLYADALAECDEFVMSVAMYKRILYFEGNTQKVLAHQGLAQLYRRSGFLYEAEQEDRLNWLIHQDVASLLRLVHNSLYQEKNGNAEYWLTQYNLSGLVFDPAVYLAKIRLLMAEGEDGRALTLAEGFDQACHGAKRDCEDGELAVKLARAEILFQQGEVDLAEALVIQLQDENSDHIEPLMCGLQMAVMIDNTTKIQPLQDRLLQLSNGDAGDLFVLQRVAGDYGLAHFARTINQKLYKMHPHSLKYGLALVRSLIEKSSFDEALDVINSLQTVYPHSLLVKLYGGQISLAMGEFQKGLAFADAIKEPPLFKTELIRARLLWGLFKRDEALQVYEDNLSPDAEEEFRTRCAKQHLVMPEISDSSLWGRVIRPMTRKRSFLERSIGSHFDSSAEFADIIQVGTTFFAQKRWQDFFRIEFAARQSLQKGEYFHAVNQYEAMGGQLAEPTLLFDLAGIYASLNRVGDEAVIYEKINQINPDFPGLAQAVNRNQLRRRPRTGITFQYFEANGRDGYKDIYQWKQEVYGWYSPRPRREGFLSASHCYYSNHDGEGVRGYELLLGVTSNVLDYFKLDMAGGVHILGDDYPDKTIFDISITGMAGDVLESSIGVKRRVVDDTMASLNRGITAEEYTAQTTIDILPRLQLGGKLFFADYSDDNEMSGYSFWGVLALRTQPDYLYFRLGYEFLDHQDGSGGSGSIRADGFQVDDHPYWSPVNYWRNQYTFGYKHTYADQILGHQVPGFLSAQYSMDYDSDGELFHHLTTGVHLEITESWLFYFDGSIDFADEYDGYRVVGTLEYRW